MLESDMKKLNYIISRRVSTYGFCSFSSLKDSLIQCRATSRIPIGAQGVITILFPYSLENEAYENANISRYACVADYHDVALKTLNEICAELRAQWQAEEFQPFVDNSPIAEVYAAALSGLGKIGSNGLLINDDYGSWVFIGEVVTTLKFDDSAQVQFCSKCGLCEKKCPTGAIINGRIDREKCLSDATQRKGDLTDKQKKMIKKSGCGWGCDVCQLVCPHNADVKPTDIDEFKNSFSPYADLENLEGKAYAWRGAAVIDRNLKIINGE
ncbi:MAG: DUF1730 domain-containing protein [Clostridia bacterium]|nr:DUF1730 domain-containing protein [Clostridia bacterium]